MVHLLAFVAASRAAPEPLEVDEIAPQWSASLAGDGVDTGPVPTGPWWDTFGEPVLDQIVQEGLTANPDLDAARARLAAVRGGLWNSASALLPSASFDLTSNGQPREVVFRCNVGPISPDEFANLGGASQDPEGLCWQGNALFNFRWAVDLFGRGVETWRAAQLEAAASEEDLAAARLRLANTLTVGYLDAVAAAAQVQILEEQLAAQTALLEVIELRYETGGASALDVLQQRQTVAATRASIPNARAAARAQLNMLAALVARSNTTPIVLNGSLPAPPPLPPIGTPAELVARRPDLAAARDRMRSANARHRAAVRGVLPQVGLSANAGWTYALADELSTLGTWGIGGSVSVPLFNGGARWGDIRTTAANAWAATRAFDTALLNAIRDVENAVVQEQEQALRFEATEVQAATARQAYQEAQNRYLAGIDSFLNVLAAQGALQAAELSRVQAHRDRLVARAQLWTALGGDTAFGESP